MDIEKSELGRLVNKYFCHCTAVVSTFDSTVFIHNSLGPVFVPLGLSVVSSIFPLFFSFEYSVVRFFEFGPNSGSDSVGFLFSHSEGLRFCFWDYRALLRLDLGLNLYPKLLLFSQCMFFLFIRFSLGLSDYIIQFLSWPSHPFSAFRPNTLCVDFFFLFIFLFRIRLPPLHLLLSIQMCSLRTCHCLYVIYSDKHSLFLFIQQIAQLVCALCIRQL